MISLALYVYTELKSWNKNAVGAAKLSSSNSPYTGLRFTNTQVGGSEMRNPPQPHNPNTAPLTLS